MKKYVLDASVILKWIFPDNDDEEDVESALCLLDLVREKQCDLYQPIHWLVEVGAVITRLSPNKSADAINLLFAMQINTRNGLGVYELANHLAVKHQHHMFDTLYHSVALCTKGATLITADKKYFKKVKDEGAIQLLGDIST